MFVMNQEKEHKNALIVFVRNAELGKVKTRLAAQIGDQKAFDVYMSLLQHTHSVAITADCDVRVYYSDYIPNVDLWDIGYCSKHLQTGGDLGQRMSAAFDETFAANYEKVLIIGSDCPQLNSQHLQKALDELNTSEVVLGPARDGGYYLMALKQSWPALFENKQWSSEILFDQTIDVLIQLGLSWYELPILADIDTAEDLERSYLADIVH